MKLLIKEVRTSKGVSLSELSRRSGISKSTLFYIETGVTDPRLGTLCKIAEALEVSVHDLLSCE